MVRAIGMVAAALWTAVAGAQVPTEIEEILVVGARLPRPVQDVVGKVDVITRDDLLGRIAMDLDDFVRYTPGVSVVRADTRFNATEFTIRGLSGNRVTTLVDGVPLADQFDIGAFSNAGQDYLIPGAVSRIEILRGPASTLFGSDALGGVMAVVTRDPEEYLHGASGHVSGSAAYRGSDHGHELSAAAAGRSGALSGVLHGSALDASELDAAGTTLEDPLDRRRRSLLLKATYALPGGDVLRLKGDVFQELVDSRPQSVLGFGRQFRNTTALAGDDRRRRYALQGEYDFAVDGSWADQGRWIAYAERTRVRQVTDELRDVSSPALAIRRRFDYHVDAVGSLLDLESRFRLGGVEHRLGWGASLRRARVEERRDGLQRDLVSGAVTSVLLGEVMPVRDFPNSTVTEVGVYLHDEVSVGPVALIPGVRFEAYRLDGKADGLFREDNPSVVVEDVHETGVVPKLGVQWRPNARFELFGQYARGFRAPPFEDVNIGLDIPMFNIRALPNPALESETSDGVELGVRYRGDRISAGAVLFGADYRDFIASKVSLGPDPDSGVLLFQSRNIDRARVYGAELSLAAALTPTLSVDAAAQWTRGEDRDTGEPLNTVDPASLVGRITWQPNARWRGSLAATAVAAQDRVDESRGALFQPDGFVTVDLTAGYTPREGVLVNVGIFNLGNETYWRWGSVRGRPVDDPQIPALAAPARYGAVSVHVTL